MTVYEADWVCPVSSAPIRNGAVGVERGQITSVGPQTEVPGHDRVRYAGCALIPGFVNAHAHLELTVFHGLLENLSFPDWIVKLTRLKYQVLDRAALKVSAQWGVVDMLRSGVTAVGEVMDVGTGWEAMGEFGLQGIAYQEVFGPAESSAPDALRALERKVAACRRDETDLMRIGVSPHAPYSVSKTLYEKTRDFSRRENVRMTAHIAESSEETRFVRDGEGTFAETHRKRQIEVTPRGCLPVAYLNSLGMLGLDMLLIHAIETSDDDLQRIRDTGTFVVHCPKSNARLGHGVARVREMRERGVAVALGTDSVASNDSVDMFEEMRMAVGQQRGLDPAAAFRMATLDGARALGMDHLFGTLEVGKRADFAVVALNPDVEDPIEAMVRATSRSEVKAVHIGGREVELDDSALRIEVARIQERLRNGAV